MNLYWPEVILHALFAFCVALILGLFFYIADVAFIETQFASATVTERHFSPGYFQTQITYVGNAPYTTLFWVPDGWSITVTTQTEAQFNNTAHEVKAILGAGRLSGSTHCKGVVL